jgi:DNA polymerase-3 subunit chi
MAEFWFYHLERSTLDQTLPPLLEKTLERGWKALVRTTSPERVASLDAHLWTYRDDSFLPHGTDSAPGSERQPVLLSSGNGAPNGADILFLIDGAEAPDWEHFARCALLFDGNDEEALADARRLWTQIKAAGAAVSYWRQTERGGWEKQG